MQQMLYESQPYIMLAYTNYLEAYRTDRFTGYIKQPSPNGDLLATWGPFAFINLKPVTGSAPAGSNGIPIGVWIAIAVGVVVVVIALTLRRRMRDEEDRA
jgi:peptide/nickel transport system substrate-binding protein